SPASGSGGFASSSSLLIRSHNRASRQADNPLIQPSETVEPPHYSALVRVFEQGLAQAIELPPTERNEMLERLDAVRVSLRGVDWGVSDAVNEIWHDRVG
ncbi:MAG: hypothetical protein AB7F78_13925, partial [Hyphomicrobiaceae bacterium]